MDGQTEYRGYIIRHRRVPTGGGVPGPGGPGPGGPVAESARDLWIISEKAGPDSEVLAGLAPSLEHAKHQVDGLLE